MNGRRGRARWVCQRPSMTLKLVETFDRCVFMHPGYVNMHIIFLIQETSRVSMYREVFFSDKGMVS